MDKTRITGAVVLVMGLAIANIAPCQAQTVKQTTDGKNVEKSLTVLVDEAKAARNYVAEHPSEKYPGLEKYLQKLINYAEAEEIENETELKKALDEAIIAVPLLIPQKTVAEVKPQSVTKEKAQPAAEAKTQSAATKASLEVESEAKTAHNNVKDEEKVENVSSEVVELPKTGEARSAGMGEFILAGAAVVIGTIGAAILILRSKKNA